MYAINGVCHQIANRLLYQSGRIVSGAHGYWFSVSTFGTYGTQVAPTAWLASSGIASAVAMCVAMDWQSRVTFSVRDLGEGPQARIDDPGREAAYLQRVRALYAETDVPAKLNGQENSLELHTKELDLMFEYRLGSDVDVERLETLRTLYRRYLSQGTGKAVQDSDGAFDAGTVAAAMNNEINNFSAEVADTLGVELFERLYGFPPDQEIVLINPRILAQADSRLEA